MRLLGVVLALVLLFLPLSVNLEAQVSNTPSEVAIEKEGKGLFFSLRKKILEKLEQSEIVEEVSSGSAESQSKLEEIQKKFENILKKLNNTEA